MEKRKDDESSGRLVAQAGPWGDVSGGLADEKLRSRR